MPLVSCHLISVSFSSLFNICLENLYRIGTPLPIHALCYAAIKDLFTYLPQSRERPEDVEVRQKLQIAAWMSLWPLQMEKPTGLGLSHSLGHKLGATYGIGHGITSVGGLSRAILLITQRAQLYSA